MRVFVLLGISMGFVSITLEEPSAQVDDSVFARPLSIEVSFLAIERLEDAGYHDIRVARQQPPTVKAFDPAGDEVEITIDQVDGGIISIRHLRTAAVGASRDNPPSARPR